MAQFRVGSSPREGTAASHLIKAMHIKYESNPRPHLYGAAAGFCPRQNFLLAKEPGGEGHHNAQSLLYMNIGNGIEDALIEGLKYNDLLFGDNVYLPPMNPKVSGKIDLVYLDEHNRIAIGEVKSCGQLPTKPKDGHFEQLVTYACVSGIDVARLIYISRNVANPDRSVAMVVFEIDLTDELLLQTMSTIVLSQVSIDNNIIPDVPITMTKSKCSGCPFNQRFCWGEDAMILPYHSGDSEQRNKIQHITSDRAKELIAERPLRRLAHLNSLLSQVNVKGSPKLSGILEREISKLEATLNG